jgi:hypothetical protein
MADKPTIVEALAAVMEDVRAVGKDARNQQQGYQFRGIDALLNAVGPAFRKHGVVCLPMLEDSTWRDVKTSTGKDSREVTVKVRYRFYGPAGDFIDAVVPGESMDFGDKGAPKAMSVAYRIALIQALCLPTHDTDPDSESFERASSGQSNQSRPADSAPESNGAGSRSPARRANDLVKILLTVDNNERAATGIERAAESPGKDINVVPLLTPAQLKVVGIEPGTVITLTEFAALVADHVKDNSAPIEPAAEGAKA